MHKFLIDEGCDAILIRTLRARNCDTKSVAELSPGMSDLDVLQSAFNEQRLLVVEDLDFGELVVRKLLSTFGVISIRIDDAFRLEKAARLLQVVNEYANQLENAFTVITLDRTRVRPLPSQSDKPDDSDE
jgi:predicted nuclease of predicted toxin-antitoxin system